MQLICAPIHTHSTPVRSGLFRFVFYIFKPSTLMENRINKTKHCSICVWTLPVWARALTPNFWRLFLRASLWPRVVGSAFLLLGDRFGLKTWRIAFDQFHILKHRHLLARLLGVMGQEKWALESGTFWSSASFMKNRSQGSETVLLLLLSERNGAAGTVLSLDISKSPGETAVASALAPGWGTLNQITHTIRHWWS